jgi:hypothetical protein
MGRLGCRYGEPLDNPVIRLNHLPLRPTVDLSLPSTSCTACTVAIEMLRHVGVDCGVIWRADIAPLAASIELEDSLSAGCRGR